MPGHRKTSDQHKREDAKSREAQRTVEHDPDSEAPRTAVPPDAPDRKKGQGRPEDH
jgi:hypothetical protein